MFPRISLRVVLLRVILACMCALIIYVLARVSFFALTERSQHESAVTLSPFLVAFMAVSAGAFAEEAFARIKGASANLIGRVDYPRRPVDPSPGANAPPAPPANEPAGATGEAPQNPPPVAPAAPPAADAPPQGPAGAEPPAQLGRTA